MPVEEVLAWLELLGRFHLAECLILHANDAHQRFFGTTGLPFLDFNGDGARTTKGSLVRKMIKQLVVLDRALELYKRGSWTSPTDRRARLLKDDVPIDDAEELERGLDRYFGEAAKNRMRATMRGLRKQIRRYRGALMRMKADAEFMGKDAWEDRGPHPLQMLWMNVSIATTWLQPPARKRTRHKHGQTEIEALGPLVSKDEDEVSTRLHAALWLAALGKPLPDPELRHKHWVKTARQLFFVLRHGLVRDPDSKVVAQHRMQAGLQHLLDVLQEQYDEKQLRDARGEAFAYDSADKAEEWYLTARNSDDRISRSLKEEAEGYFAVRFRN